MNVYGAADEKFPDLIVYGNVDELAGCAQIWRWDVSNLETRPLNAKVWEREANEHYVEPEIPKCDGSEGAASRP
jgi:hypothetical protein